MTILRRSILQSALVVPAALVVSSRSRASVSHRGTWAVNTGTGVFMSANNVPNLPSNGSMFLGSYWYWHTTPPTDSTGQALLRAGAELINAINNGLDVPAGHMLSIDHDSNGVGGSVVQIGISGGSPSFGQNWWWSGSIPTGNLGYNNIIWAIDSSGVNAPRFLLNGIPIAANTGYYNVPGLTANMTNAPVWHLASGLGGKRGNTPAYPFKGNIAEFVLFSLSSWIDPMSVVSAFYDASAESPPDWGSLDITGNSFLLGLTPILYFSGGPQSYVHNLHAGTNVGGRLTTDPNQTFNVIGMFDDAPSDPWGNVGS